MDWDHESLRQMAEAIADGQATIVKSQDSITITRPIKWQTLTVRNTGNSTCEIYDRTPHGEGG